MLLRALSKALYNTENMHTLLRLLSSLEIACFPAAYDPARSDYDNLLADSHISVPAYIDCM